MPDTANISDSEDTDSVHLPKIKPRSEWLKPIPEEDRPETPKPDWFVPPNDLHEPENNWANALANFHKDLEENKPSIQGSQSLSKNNISLQFQMEECHRMLMDQVDLVNPEGHQLVPNVSKPLSLEDHLIESECEYDISAAYGISHWWFKRKEFYITRHSAPSDRSTVRSHMQILNVVSLKTYERYGYPFLKEIVLRRADYKEYKISEADFKNLHPNDFEDLYLLHLQGQLNHLSGAEKVHLFNAVNLWIRNIIAKNRVEDLQLVIESYQTKLNLTQLDWDASDFLFKEDYIIVSKPRVVIYRVRNDQKKMMRETKVHKFSDGTLNRILDKLDHMVKDFKMFKNNKGMET
ncbi:hypothetical protein Tco_0768591 [Tanacetum coccineum]